MLQGHAQPFIDLPATDADLRHADARADRSRSIPAGIDVLLIVHPAQLSDQQLYAIDQFVLHGGRALVFVDPESEIAGAASRASASRAAARLHPTCRSCSRPGASHTTPDKVVGDRDARAARAGRRPAQSGAALSGLAACRHGDKFNHNDQVTANLQTLNLASVGALSPAERCDHDFHAAGVAPPATRRCSMPRRCAWAVPARSD